MSLSCLTKPLLIPAGLWMFRDVSDVNKQCQSSAVTFDPCHSVVFGPALRAGTIVIQWFILYCVYVQYVCVCESVYMRVCIFISLYVFSTCYVRVSGRRACGGPKW